MKKRKQWGILAIIILISWTVILWKNIDYQYTLQGVETTLGREAYAGVSNYEVEGNLYRVNGEDPQLYLKFQKNVGGMNLYCYSNTGEDLPVQVFYAKAGENYTEKHSVKTMVKAGRTFCTIPIPLGEYDSFRLDIDGDFLLDRILVYEGETKVMPVISTDTVRSCLLYCPVALAAILLIFWAHSVRAGEMGAKAYMKQLFGTENNRTARQIHWDYLRVLAAVLVVLAHSCSPMVDLADTDWKRMLLVMGLTLGLSCNVIYVMLSGALLLNSKREESVGIFYIRRASKVVIPLIAYYLLLLSLNDEVSFLPPQNLGSVWKRILTGAPDAGPHLWLIYTIVALYLITPFFRVMVQHLSDKMLLSLAVLIMVCNALTLYLPLAGVNFGISTFLAGWEGVFLLGYIMTRSETRKYDRKIIIAGVISFATAVIVVFFNSSNMNYVYNNAITLILISCGIFALVLGNTKWFENKDNAMIRLCSKYSYAIILIHWYALFVIVQGKFHVTALRFGCVGGIVATVVLAFGVSLVLGMLYDNTVVIVCSVLFDKLTALFHKGHK